MKEIKERHNKTHEDTKEKIKSKNRYKIVWKSRKKKRKGRIRQNDRAGRNRIIEETITRRK